MASSKHLFFILSSKSIFVDGHHKGGHLFDKQE